MHGLLEKIFHPTEFDLQNWKEFRTITTKVFTVHDDVCHILQTPTLRSAHGRPGPSCQLVAPSGPARWKKPRCNGKRRKTHHWKVPFFVAIATFLVALSQTERPQLVTIVRGFMSYISDARIMKGAEGICGWHKDDVSHLQKPTRSYITPTSTWTGHSGEIKPSYVYLLFTWASPEIKTPKYLGFFSRIQLLSSNLSLGSPASTWALCWRSFCDKAPFEANALVEHRDFACSFRWTLLLGWQVFVKKYP